MGIRSYPQIRLGNIIFALVYHLQLKFNISTRNYLATKSFIKEVLNYCENKPKFLTSELPLAYARGFSLSILPSRQGFIREFGGSLPHPIP